jgi:hypothetical protein
MVKLPSHIFVSIFCMMQAPPSVSPCLATVRNADPLPEILRKRHGSSRLVTGRVTGKAQKFSHFPQVVTVSRVKRGMGEVAHQSALPCFVISVISVKNEKRPFSKHFKVRNLAL